METEQVVAMCAHSDGTEHPAPVNADGLASTCGRATADEWAAEHYPQSATDPACQGCIELSGTVARLGDETDGLVTALDMAQAVGDALALDMVHLRRIVVALVTDLLVMDTEQAIDLADWPAAARSSRCSGATMRDSSRRCSATCPASRARTRRRCLPRGASSARARSAARTRHSRRRGRRPSTGGCRRALRFRVGDAADMAGTADTAAYAGNDDLPV